MTDTDTTSFLFGEVDNFGIGLEMSLVQGETTPKEIWENKDSYFEFAEKSKEYWDNMTDDQRAAVLRLVRHGIERIYDRIDEWVPEALEVEGGKYIDVHFKLLFTNIDEEIERNEEATTFQIKNAASHTLQKLAEVSSEDTEEE